MKKKGINDLEFDVFEYSKNGVEGLIDLEEEMFHKLGLVKHFKIDVDILRKFLVAIQKSYKNSPFHDCIHSFDVTQMMYLLLTKGGGQKLLSPADVLVLMISALSHDMFHPGLNNRFLALTKSPLVDKYGEYSTLEKYSLHSVLSLLRSDDTNFIKSLPQEQVNEIESLISMCILATDMMRHYEVIVAYNVCVKGHFKGKFTTNNMRGLFMQVLLKMADISNPMRPLNIAKIWSDRVMTEFFAQGDKEKDLGLPITPTMDRTLVIPSKAHCTFIDAAVIPLIDSLNVVWKDKDYWVQYLYENYKVWS